MDINRATVPIFVITVFIIIGSAFSHHYQEAKTIHVYVPNIIEPDQESDYLIKQIKAAHKGDNMVVHINSRGGDSDTGKKIRDAIRDSPATIVGEVDGMAASAGADIMLDCPIIKFENTQTRVLFHIARYFYIIDDYGVKHYVGNPDTLPIGLQDKVKTEFDDMNNPTDRDKEMLPRYQQLLTENEINRVFIKHEDVWISGVEMAKRLTNAGRNVKCGWK